MVSIDVIQEKIRVVRGEKVMLDCDLARLYGVETKRLNEQVKRNSGRFPERFMFQLTQDEFDILRSQFATSSWGGTRKPPFAFTEHGALMVSTVLNSAQAISMSIYIIEAFVKMRSLVMSHAEILKRLDELEKNVGRHDRSLAQIINAIRQLMPTTEMPKKKIGF
ncbi:MAG TPA: ORF6N domain-containing protein [Spirochaetota bacterium]|nr:ORF6N domain-containing protein [Spirochaetota bacterium]HOS41350.1 ORF6N domain-containing protein [Spirochaetota bacterium]HPU87855.1 ORF6N domain-containing protein [Spirochaetota bacterium]